MAFFKNLFRKPSQEETLEKIAKLQEEEKVLSLQEKVFSKKEELQKRVSGLRKEKFKRSLAGKATKAFGKLGSALAKGSGKDIDLFESQGPNLFGSPGPQKKSKKKSSDDIDNIIGF